ncbi:MAG: AMP-binding protein [Leptospiraceae bacterium]|nr:AMP-binding protein [Leptospiraceae bacterium]MCB1302866.1 AMP-binding protein [Leptospiraceae bacterium]
MNPESPDSTLYHIFKESANRNPDRVCQRFRVKGGPLQGVTYQQFYDELTEIAAGLLELGFEKADRVALIADVGPQWLRIAGALNSIGIVDVPRGTDATTEDLRYILGHSEARAVFLENREAFDKLQKTIEELKTLRYIFFYESAQGVDVPATVAALSLSDLREKGKKHLEGNPGAVDKVGSSVVPRDLATIIYTSGTTGTPKGVMLSHSNLAWEARTILEILRQQGTPYTSEDRSLGFLPPWHIGERMWETVLFFSGSSIAFTSVTNLSKDLAEVKPTVLFSVPRVWEAMYNRILETVKQAPPLRQKIFHFFRKNALRFRFHWDRLRGRTYHLKPVSGIVILLEKIVSFLYVLFFWPLFLLSRAAFKKVRGVLGGAIRFAVSGAGALPEHIDRLFAAIGVPIFEVYGMTETSAVSVARLGKTFVIGTVGRPVAGIEIKLIDAHGSIVTEPGKKGVAHHRGPHIMQGYYKEQDKTAATLKDGWLDSGDLLVWTREGYLKFAGRAKDTIVLLGGENLEPEPLEFALIQSPFIHQVMVVGQDKKSLGALIVPDHDALEKQLREWNLEGAIDPQYYNLNEEIVKLYKQEIRKRVSAETGFKSFEKIGAFYLLAEPFKPGDELTQTLKVRRNVVADKYEHQINEMYRQVKG